MLARMTTTSAPADGLDLLVLGGTSWVGGVVARTALARGHRVTCLARGEAGDPPAGVTWVRADREQPGAYDEVVGARWDAVVEVSWQPELVRGALKALSGVVGHWVYVSSGSSGRASEEAPAPRPQGRRAGQPISPGRRRPWLVRAPSVLEHHRQNREQRRSR